MAEVAIADVIVPEVFAPYVQRNSTELTELWQSGVVVTEPVLSANLRGGGQTFQVPAWNDLLGTEPAVASDAVGTAKTHEEILTHKDIAIRHNRVQSWAAMNLAGQLAGSDPMTAIGNRVASYWSRRFQAHLIASVKGMLLAEATLLVNVYTDVAMDATSGARSFTPTNFLKAVQTMGDMGEELGVVIMHSATYRRAQADNLVTYWARNTITDPQQIGLGVTGGAGVVSIPTYMGRRVMVDDSLPAVAGTNAVAYDTFIVGPGAFAYGEGGEVGFVPVETWRNPSAGNGGGQDVLFSRRQFVLHPRGFQWLSGSMVGSSPTNTELALAANWDMVTPYRKAVNVAVLRHGLIPL